MEELVLVAEKRIWPQEQRLVIMLVLGLFNARGFFQMLTIHSADSTPY